MSHAFDGAAFDPGAFDGVLAFAGTADLEAPAATLAAAAVETFRAGAVALAAPAAQADVEGGVVFLAVGTLQARRAAAAGTGTETITGSGALTAPASRGFASEQVTLVGSGDLWSIASTFAAEGDNTPPALAAEEEAPEGAAGALILIAPRPVEGRGQLTAPPARLAGRGSVTKPTIRGAGRLGAPPARVRARGELDLIPLEDEELAELEAAGAL